MMATQPENFESDLSQRDMSQKEKVFQKTNTEMWKVFDSEFEASSPSFIIEKVKELNPDVEIKTDIDRSIIFASASVEDLKLPEWFYYNQKNWITNKHNTQSGIYGSVHVYPIEYYDPNFI